MRKGLLKGLTEEQIARIKNCHSSAEFLELAKEEGIQLTDEQLSAISGGGCSSDDDDDKKDRTHHRRIDS